MKIKNLFINIFLINSLMLLNVVAFSQIDEGVNYKIDSKTSKLGSQINQCDVIYTTNGLNISSSVKQINDGVLSYKICNDFGVNATIIGSLKTINTNKINKIVFSDGSVKYLNLKKVGYYSSVYTDGFSDQIGLSGGFTLRLFKFLDIYSGIGYEFVDSEEQIEFGYIQRGIFFKKLIYDVGYRYNFDNSLYDGFRTGVGFKF